MNVYVNLARCGACLMFVVAQNFVVPKTSQSSNILIKIFIYFLINLFYHIKS